MATAQMAQFGMLNDDDKPDLFVSDSDPFTFGDSPANSMFPGDISANMFLNTSGDSYASSSNDQSSGLSDHGLHPYLSRPPSLSPSSQSAQLYPPMHSPHSSASPRSNFSFSSAEDMLFNPNNFLHSDLDMLLFQTDTSMDQGQSKQPFFLPQQQANYIDPAASKIGLSDQETLELLNFVNATSGQPQQPQVVNTNMWANANWNPPPQQVTAKPANTFDFKPNINVPQLPPAKPTKAAPKKAPRKNAKSESPSDGPALGKHNKTERRYRQKVQAAQADLRDAVPALRVLYGTSTEEQLRTTDIKSVDGTVDGIGEINRPNASAKTTIFVGARLYIELLQERVAGLQRQVDELEAFRTAVAGEENVRKWREDFEAREQLIRAARPAKVDDDSQEDDDDDESEDDAPKRKKAKTAAKPKAKKGGEGLTAFAAFAFAFSFLPSSSILLGSTSQPHAGSVLYEQATTTQVFQRLPLITAEHTSRLLGQALPAMMVPEPITLVSWTWRLLFAAVLTLLLRPLLRRFNKPSAVGVPAGQASEVVKDVAKACVPLKLRSGDDAAWVKLASDVVGNVVDLPVLARAHLVLRLNRIADDTHSLALLALLQPDVPLLRSAESIWTKASESLTSDSPATLAQVLALPLTEATRALELLPATSSPITAIAEQVTLVHLNDLFSRFFVQLVDATTLGGRGLPDSVKTLLANLESRDARQVLRSSLFESEIRAVIEGVPRGTAAHALGLVLIGLWGLVTGPAPSAQAALASALAAEEVKGVGSALTSVSTLREFLYPGSGLSSALGLAVLPANALTIDKLALVCIEYIRLLASTTALDEQTSRLERLEKSKSVQKAVSRIRLALTQTTFEGLVEDEAEEKSFDLARVRLVGVLSSVGRRAAGRATGRDEDSGLEGDLEEL